MTNIYSIRYIGSTNYFNEVMDVNDIPRDIGYYDAIEEDSINTYLDELINTNIDKMSDKDIEKVIYEYGIFKAFNLLKDKNVCIEDYDIIEIGRMTVSLIMYEMYEVYDTGVKIDF